MQSPPMQSMPMLTVAVNTRCNQRCAYCPPMGESYMCGPGDLPPDTAREVLDVAIARGVRVLRFSGGEPTMHPRFAEFLPMMRAAKQAGAVVHLNTNGVLLGKHLPLIDNTVVDSLRVSLDSMNPHRYHEITGTNLLEVVLSNIRGARAQGLPVDLIMVVMRHNLGDVDDVVHFCAAHGVGLKLSDLERNAYDKQGLWERQFVSMDVVRALLADRAASIRAVQPIGDFGMAMSDYQIEGAIVRVKDSFVSSTYNDHCRTRCPIFPCPEGIYSLLLKPDSTISWCKRNSSVAVPLLPGRTAEAFDQCLADLRSCTRMEHAALPVLERKTGHWLAGVADAPSRTGGGADKGEWVYRGNQKAFSRDR